MSGILTCFHILVDMMAYNPDKPEVNPELSLSDLNIRLLFKIFNVMAEFS